MKKAVDHYSLEFVLKRIGTIKRSIVTDGIDAYEQIAGEDIALTIINFNIYKFKTINNNEVTKCPECNCQNKR